MPGSIRTFAPVAMIRLSVVYDGLVAVLVAPRRVVLPSLVPVIVPQPSSSVILFFFIR